MVYRRIINKLHSEPKARAPVLQSHRMNFKVVEYKIVNPDKFQAEETPRLWKLEEEFFKVTGKLQKIEVKNEGSQFLCWHGRIYMQINEKFKTRLCIANLLLHEDAGLEDQIDGRFCSSSK